jgi:regulatory protein
VLARVAELGLVDDRAFARQWVEERSRRLGPAVLVSELQAKGVDRDVAEEAVAAAGLDEEAQARDLAARLVAKVAGRPLREQRFRLQTMLSRRGISEEAAAAGVRAVLPPEGWD